MAEQEKTNWWDFLTKKGTPVPTSGTGSATSPGKQIIQGLTNFGVKLSQAAVQSGGNPGPGKSGYDAAADRMAALGGAPAGSYTGFNPTAASTQAAIVAERPEYKANLEQYTAQFAPASTTGQKVVTDGKVGGEVVIPRTEDGKVDYTKINTKDITPNYLFQVEGQLYKQLRAYQEMMATNASEQQKRALAQAIQQTRMDYDTMRNVMAENAFTQDRALVQAAAQRGMGGSGLEQLGRTQQRMALGQNLNQLSKQYGAQTQAFLNTQLGIEENLAAAMSKAALDETINVSTSMAKAMDNEWTAWQRSATMEDRAKFGNQETAGLYLEYISALQNAGEDAAMKEQIRSAYKDLIPENLWTKGSELATTKGLGDVMRNVESGLASAPAWSDAAEKQRFEQAMAQERASPNSDGRLSMLSFGATKLYFTDDTNMVSYVKKLYASRENANSIQITVKAGKIMYITPDGQEFDTYNKASNAIG